MKKFFREPLVHFLLIGAGLFLLFGWRGGPASFPAGPSGPQSAKIVVATSEIDQMTGTFTRTWQRPPTEEEVKGLVEDFVRNEIYYREALAIGLDRDDGVIRRRLRQKMEFIFEDISSRTEPTEEDLLAYMKKHPLYKKALKKTRRFACHNELSDIAVGDTVEIRQVRPVSKTKHFLVVKKIV